MADSRRDEPTNGARPKRESDAPDGPRIVKRYERLLGQRGTVDVTQQELADFLIPRKAVITRTPTEGEEQTQRVWDATGIHANELLASSIQGSLMSPAIRWFSLKLRDSTVQTKDVMDWLEAVTERMYQALRQSNFNAEIGEVCLDLGAFGIGAVFIEERPLEAGEDGFGGFRFKALAPGSYVIAEDFEGRVDTLMRCEKMTARTIEQQFGKEGTIPEPIRTALDAQLLDKEFEVIHAVYPRRVANPKRQDAQHMRWASCYVDRRTKTVLSEGGYPEFPYCVPRWAKTSGETYGRGPGHTALPAIRTLSRAKELILSAASKALDPPGLFNSDAVFGTLDIRPASQNPVEGDPRLAWVPLESGAKFDVAQLVTAEERQQIQHIFFWEQLQLQGDRPMTATEVERRLEIMRRVLGPVLGRYESELLSPSLQREFSLMLRAGALPEIPEVLSQQNLDIEYEGPLARSQKATRLAASDEVFAKLAQIAAFAPEVAVSLLDNFDLDDWIRDQATIAGLPSENLADEQERDQVRAQRAQQQANAQKMQQMQALAEGAGKLAPFMDSLQNATGAANGKAA